MTVLADGVNLGTPGVVDGIYTSDPFTATGNFTLNIWGNFDGAKVDMEVSTYNDGVNDIFVLFRNGIKGPNIENVETDASIIYRAKVRELTDQSSVFITTGGKNE